MRDAVTANLFTAADLVTKDVKIRVSSIREGFTPSDPTLPDLVLIDTSAKLLSTPLSFTVVNDPYGLGRDDSTIRVEIPYYTGTEQHTGYIVEVSNSSSFDPATDWPWVQAISWYTETGTGKVEDAVPVDDDVTIDINLGLDLYREILGATLPGTVYVRVRANKNGYDSSDPTSVKSVAVSEQIWLESPEGAAMENDNSDSIIRVTVTPLSSRTPGKVIETGYMVNFLPADGILTFATAKWDEMYHYYYNYDKTGDGIYDEVDKILAFDVDMQAAVDNVDTFTWSTLRAVGVIAEVTSIRGGFTPAEPSRNAGRVDVSNVSRLENPGQARVSVVNEGDDRVITVTIENYDPVKLGQYVPPYIVHKKDIRHTGYRIDICKDTDYDWDETFHSYNFYYLPDDEDEEPDVIKGANPDDMRVDIDLDLAREQLTGAFGGAVNVRVFAIRDGYALNEEDLHNFSVSFQDRTRLENPDYRVVAYNSKPGATYEEIDRTITIEVEPYDPSGVASGINAKDANHAGYQIDMSRSQTFAPEYTFSYYYLYDDFATPQTPDDITSALTEDTKIHIDLDVCREIWENIPLPPPPPPGGGGPGGPIAPSIYIRVLAMKPGYAINYEDTPSTPLTVEFRDRSLLTQPPFASVMNPRNMNSGNDTDSSIFMIISETTPVGEMHDGYAIRVELLDADGKPHSRTMYYTSLAPVIPTLPDLPYIAEQKLTIDIKEMFEPDIEHANLLRDILGIQDDEKYRINKVEVSSMKVGIPAGTLGYTNSDVLTANFVFGSERFKNTSASFLPTPVVTVTPASGSATMQINIEDYDDTAPAPPHGGGDGLTVLCWLQFSVDNTFPWDTTGTVTINHYEGEVEDIHGNGTGTFNPPNVDVHVLLENATANTIYARARFAKEGYTVGPVTAFDTIVVTEFPPVIVDFTANPTIDQAPVLVSFLASDITGAVTNYDWDFGDESTGSGVSTLHPYMSGGRYTVRLVVTGPGGSDEMIKEGYVILGDEVVGPAEDIQDAVARVSDDGVVLVPDKTYTENIIIDGKNNITLMGESVYGTIIEGNIVCMDSSATIRDLTTLYNNNGERVTYTNVHYPDGVTIVSDAGITAVNSEITVDSCAITPYAADSRLGKGIQIWNLYGNGSVAPIIANCLITNTDAAIYLYSHASAGDFDSGWIGYNTLDQNNYGIVLRMPTDTSDPLIESNIITDSIDAIHLTYSTRQLLNERLDGKILNNCFFGNDHNVWCDDIQQDRLPPADLQGLNAQRNIAEDPEYVQPFNYPSYVHPADLTYTPQNQDCDLMGIQGVMR
jgi:PKD repeat protein